MIKAACHIHSDWSYDGKWRLKNLSSEFARRGYRVLLMTEHDRGFNETRRLQHREACEQASSSEILVVPGIEYSDAENIVHVLVWGSVPFLGENVPTSELLKQVRAANGIAVLAHPSRKNAWQKFETSWISELIGIEMWNRKTDGWAPSRTARALIDRSTLLPFMGLDFHDRRQFFPLATMLDLESPVSEARVLAELRAGRCRSFAFGAPVERILVPHRELGLRGIERCRRFAAMVYRTTRLSRQ